ncbi:MAG: hypothetical protein IIY93_06030 [Clostridia bacterium]|nr:hypothetical protein [Clostridia bacterium]MBQ1555131.1 hypothetical protein [Clostridia bacterium]
MKKEQKMQTRTAPDRLTVRRLFLMALFGCVMLLVLTGCGMKTNLKMNSDFAGERIMVCEEISDTSLIFSSKKVKDITESLQNNCPEQLQFSYEYSDSKQSKVVYTFSLPFNDIEDYKTKVAALIGRTPSVQYTYRSPEEDLFKSGFSLTEDFESKDLLAWVKPALKKDLNLSQNVSSMTDSVTITLNDVSYDNDNLMSSRIKIDTIAQYRLSSLDIETIRYGDDDYKREVVLNMPKKTVETLGKENIQTFMQNATASGAAGQWLSDEGSTSRYRVSFSGTADDIDACTKQLFGGSSSFSYVKDETLYTAFSETGVLTEKLDFSKFPCENNGTCNANITYKNMDASEFDGEKSTLYAGSKRINGEGRFDENKTVKLIYQKASNADIKLYSSTVYKLSEVDVVTEIGSDDKVSQSIILASPIDTEDYGAQFAAAYFKRRLEGSEFTVNVAPFNEAGTQYAVTISTPKTSEEKVNAMLANYFGAGNAVSVDGQDQFTFYNKRNVSVQVDLAEELKPSQYTGEIMYSFKGPGQAYDVDWTASDGGKSDILMGAYRTDTFEHPISSHTFTITYHLRRINLMFVLLIAGLVLAAAGIVLMTAGRLALGRRKKREAEKLAAVKTMALVKMPDGTETMMEVTPEEAAQTVVISPKHDDGLDEDDDEPENLWLFSTALRLFSVMAGVLFFLGFGSLAWNDIIPRTGSISGLDLVLGKTLMNRTLEGFYLNAILLVIPVAIFLLLSFRYTLPKLLDDIAVIGLSALQIWYLLGLPTTMEEQVNAFGAEVSKRISLEMSWGYHYSIMIYVLLALGGVLLVLIDTGIAIHRSNRSNQ